MACTLCGRQSRTRFAHERWAVEVTDGNGTIHLSSLTPDLQDGIVTASAAGNFAEAITIQNGVTNVRILHAEAISGVTSGNANSVVPAGFCYLFRC